MKTYTFKIKVDTDKVVVACHMQLEQFYDSVKLSHMENLVSRYPHAYITACDYKFIDADNEDAFCHSDYVVSSLDLLIKSKDLKSYLISDGFLGFIGDDSWNYELGCKLADSASQYIKDIDNVLECEEAKDGISEAEKE